MNVKSVIMQIWVLQNLMMGEKNNPQEDLLVTFYMITRKFASLVGR